MNNNFKLLISCPIELHVKDELDETINEALQTIYPYTKESSVYIKWNNYIFELNLAAQIADIYQDIFKMMSLLLDKSKKKFVIHWGSNSFMAQWSFYREDRGILKIKSDWTTIGESEKNKQINKICNILFIDECIFLSEWLGLLSLIYADLLRVGYQNLKEVNELENLLNKYAVSQ